MAKYVVKLALQMLNILFVLVCNYIACFNRIQLVRKNAAGVGTIPVLPVSLPVHSASYGGGSTT